MMSALMVKIVTTLTATLPGIPLSRPTVIIAANSSIVIPSPPLVPIGAIVSGVVGSIGKLLNRSYF
jgi:hypothetical protein